MYYGRKGENVGYQYFLLFLQGFQKSISLDLLTLSWFLPVCSISLLKTLRVKRRNCSKCTIFPFSSVFYPFEEVSAIFIKVIIVVCKLFQFRRVLILLFGKGLTYYQSIMTYNNPQKEAYLKHCGEKGENAGNQPFFFSFSHNVFYPYRQNDP